MKQKAQLEGEKRSTKSQRRRFKDQTVLERKEECETRSRCEGKRVRVWEVVSYGEV